MRRLPKTNKSKICAIDIGTNSVLYLLAEISNSNRIKFLSSDVKTTRLGKSLHKNHALSLTSQRRTINTIVELLKNADKQNVDHYVIAGTSALREANNTNTFKNTLLEKTGILPVVLTEDEEARLTFSAVKHCLNIKNKGSVITDIGGGSTEIIIALNGEIKAIMSIPLGAVYLTDKYGTNTAGLEQNVNNKLEKYFAAVINRNIFRHKLKFSELIGVGGTVTTLGAISQKMKKYDAEKVHQYVISYHNINALLNKLKNLNLSERKKFIPFDPKRADIIIAGTIILKTIMEILNIDRLKICERGLVYGLAINYSKYTRGTLNLHKTS